MKRVLLAALAASILVMPAAVAKGGGGGGHGGGVTYYSIPIYIPAPQVPGADVGGYEKIHRVALLSAIGTGLALQNDHFLLPKTGTLDISSWHVDDQVNATVRKYLGSRFAFSDVPFDAKKLAPILPSWWHAGEMAKFLKTVPNKDIDAFIIVRPDTASGLLLETAGYGTTLWVRYEFDVIDAHTYKQIAQSTSRLLFRQGALPSFPGRMVPAEFKLDDTLTVGADNQEKLRTWTSQMLDYTLLETIRSLQFGVTLPPVGDHSIVPVPTADATARIKSIAIASAIGDNFCFYDKGGMLVPDKSTLLPIADWQIDNEAEAAVRKAVEGRFVVKDVPVDRALLAKVGAKLATPPPFLGALSPGQDVDAYVLLLKAPLTKDGQDNLGLWHNSSLLAEFTDAFATYLIVVVDAHTMKPILARFATMSAASARAYPDARVDNKLWPKTPGKLTPDAAAQLHQAISHLLDDSIPETLYRIGMTNQNVAPGASETDAAPQPQESAAPAATAAPPAAVPSAAPPEKQPDAK